MYSGDDNILIPCFAEFRNQDGFHGRECSAIFFLSDYCIDVEVEIRPYYIIGK